MIDHDEKRLTVDFRLSPVLVIIFHHGEAAFTGPIDVAGVYDDYGFMDDFVPHRRALLFDLNTLREDEIPDDPETPELFAVLRIMQVIFSTDIGTKSRIVLERLKPYSEIPKYRRLIRFLWFYLVSSERHLARRELMAVTKTVKKVIGEKNMPTILEQLRAEGKAEGLAEAETKALVEKAETLLTVIRARFKNMSKTAEDKVRKVKDKVVLDLLVAHAATCESLGDFEKHLRFDKKRIHDSQMSTHLELTAWWFVLSTNTTTFWDFWIISSKNMRKFPAYKNGLATKQLKTSLRRSKK